jgi:phage terminase large subunit
LEAQTLPQLLNLPEKLYPVVEQLDRYRYFLLEGGRGGGKSQSLGRFILYLCDKYNIRVVCGREVQNSIQESVYSLLADLIRVHNLPFEVMSTKITSFTTGSTINFRGFREQGAFNIQGMEGVDIVWIDEAQALTKQTLDVLIPTIRKDNAKVFFSMNRHVVNDPAYSQFVNRDDCLHININFYDNPFCTLALKKEAEECKKISEKDYKHIWLGEPLDMAEDSVYSMAELQYSKTNKCNLRDGYGIRVAGFDIARYGDDKCAVVILQQMGALHWETLLVDEWDHRDLNYTTGRILHTTNEHNVQRAIIDEDGLGAGPFDTLTKGRGLDYFVGFRNPTIGYGENKEFANPRTVNAYRLKDLLMKNHIHITDDRLITECMGIKYTFDHNQRRILVSKDEMRKKGFKSPNMYDALIMAVSLMGDEKLQQDQQYTPRINQSAREESLFGIAGIK